MLRIVLAAAVFLFLSIPLVGAAESLKGAKAAYRLGAEAKGGRRVGQKPADWSEAARHFRVALKAPFTEADRKYGGEEPSVWLPLPQAETMFRSSVRRELIECLCWLGPEAEPEIWQLLEGRPKTLLPVSTVVLGKAEEESGGRAIERWFRENEDAFKNRVSYWLQRGEYQRGRGNVEEEERLWRLTIDLVLESPELNENDLDRQASRLVVLGYFKILTDSQRQPEAIALARSFMAELEESSILAQTAAEHMVRLKSGTFRPIDPIFWEWLAKRSHWERPEESILTKIFRAGRGKEVGENRRQAEALAKKSPGRALVMGKVLLENKYPEHAAMFLQTCIESPISEHQVGQAKHWLKQAREASAR